MLAKKDLTKTTWEMLQTMHVGVEIVKEENVQTLKSEFEVIRIKDGESIYDIAMKLTMIVNSLHRTHNQTVWSNEEIEL